MCEDEFETLKQSPSIEYRPETQGYFGVLPSIANPSRSFSVYFKKGPKTIPTKETTLVIGIAGFTGNPEDLGVHASKLLPESEATSVDVLLIGMTWDEMPEKQKKRGANLDGGYIGKLLGGSIHARVTGFTFAPRTFLYGGLITRSIKEPIDDINHLLDGSFNVADSTTQDTITITPNTYKTWIFLGQCRGCLTGWELQLNRLQNNKRLINAFIGDSVPYQTATYTPVPILQKLKNLGAPAKTLIIRGTKDTRCPWTGSQKILELSAPGSEMVTFYPYRHISTMYNGRRGEQKIYGGRDIAGGLMRQFIDSIVKENF